MTEDIYVRNYFRRDRSEGGNEEKVPIRWMAPESIEMRTYHEKTDVVRHPLYISACYWNRCTRSLHGTYRCFT